MMSDSKYCGQCRHYAGNIDHGPCTEGLDDPDDPWEVSAADVVSWYSRACSVWQPREEGDGG